MLQLCVCLGSIFYCSLDGALFCTTVLHIYGVKAATLYIFYTVFLFFFFRVYAYFYYRFFLAYFPFLTLHYLFLLDLSRTPFTVSLYM